MLGNWMRIRRYGKSGTLVMMRMGTTLGRLGGGRKDRGRHASSVRNSRGNLNSSSIREKKDEV